MNSETLFNAISDEEMLEIYKDILESAELGMTARSLDTYANKISKEWSIGFAQAHSTAENMFYENIAKRYFGNRK